MAAFREINLDNQKRETLRFFPYLNSALAKGRQVAVCARKRISKAFSIDSVEYHIITTQIFDVLSRLHRGKSYLDKTRLETPRGLEEEAIEYRKRFLMKKYFRIWKKVIETQLRLLYKKRTLGLAFDEYEESTKKRFKFDFYGNLSLQQQSKSISIEYVRARSILKKSKMVPRYLRFVRTTKEIRERSLSKDGGLKVRWDLLSNRESEYYTSLAPQISIFPFGWSRYRKERGNFGDDISAVEYCTTEMEIE
ncbi:hypothetical protein G9A89_022564 [Geosiphon pyriformis]|nr:hypothetical protein G9A89_022564 [Geosiphon pyriformis]